MLSEQVPALDDYYGAAKHWPEESLTRREALFVG